MPQPPWPGLKPKPVDPAMPPGGPPYQPELWLPMEDFGYDWMDDEQGPSYPGGNRIAPSGLAGFKEGRVPLATSRDGFMAEPWG